MTDEVKKALDALAKKVNEQSESIENNHQRIRGLRDSIKELSKRIFALEEEERQRARADHQREEYLDWENVEGLSRV